MLFVVLGKSRGTSLALYKIFLIQSILSLEFNSLIVSGKLIRRPIFWQLLPFLGTFAILFFPSSKTLHYLIQLSGPFFLLFPASAILLSWQLGGSVRSSSAM